MRKKMWNCSIVVSVGNNEWYFPLKYKYGSI